MKVINFSISARRRRNFLKNVHQNHKFCNNFGVTEGNSVLEGPVTKLKATFCLRRFFSLILAKKKVFS